MDPLARELFGPTEMPPVSRPTAFKGHTVYDVCCADPDICVCDCLYCDCRYAEAEE